MNCLFHVSFAAVRLQSSVVRRFYANGKRVYQALQAVSSLALLLALIVPGTLLRAQTFYGSISGVVKDPSGAVVPGVAVTVREGSTTTEYKTVTDKGGSYRVSFLKPGGYSVRFEKDGFDRFVIGELNIVLNKELVIDGSLRVGANSDAASV